MRYIYLILLLLLVNVSCKKTDGIEIPSVLQLEVTSDGASPADNVNADIFVFKEPSGDIDRYKHEDNMPAGEINVDCTAGERTVVIVENSKIDFEKNPIANKKELEGKSFLLSDSGTNVQLSSRSMYGSSKVMKITGGSGNKGTINLKRHAAEVIVNWNAGANGNTTDGNGWTTIGADKGHKGDMYKIEKVILMNAPSKCSIQPNIQLPITSYLCGTDAILSPSLKAHNQTETNALIQILSPAQNNIANKVGIYTYANHPSKTVLPTKAVLIARYKTVGSQPSDQGTLCYYPITINYGKNTEEYKIGTDGKSHITTGADIGNGISSNTVYRVMADITGRGVTDIWRDPVNLKVKVEILDWKKLDLKTNIGDGKGTDLKNKDIAFVSHGLTAIPRAITLKPPVAMSPAIIFEYKINIHTYYNKPTTHKITFDNGFIGTIDWGDGKIDTHSSTDPKGLTHEYSSNGEYEVKVYGKWKKTEVQILFMDGDLNEENISLVSLSGGATKFLVKGQVIKAINGNFFQASSNTITNLVAAFSNNYKIEKIPSKLLDNCTHVTNMSYMFNDCIKLTSIPDRLLDDCTHVTNMSNMFNYCTALRGTIPSRFLDNCTQLTDMSNMFNNCVFLNGFLRLPKSVNKTGWNNNTQLKEL